MDTDLFYSGGERRGKPITINKGIHPMKNRSLKRFNPLIYMIAVAFALSSNAGADEFKSEWPDGIERVWAGPEYWANRLQDWRVREGRLENVFQGKNRNVQLLTHQVNGSAGGFSIRVRLGLVPGERGSAPAQGWAGFLVGAKGEFNDYRDSAVHGKGLSAGVSCSGELFIGQWKAVEAKAQEPCSRLRTGIELLFTANPEGENFIVGLTAYDPRTGSMLSHICKRNLPQDELSGNLALVSHFKNKSSSSEDKVCAWFSGWTAQGPGIEARPDRAFGPVLFAQHTLSRGILKMTAQMPPLCDKDGRVVSLQVKGASSTIWKTVSEAAIEPFSCTAALRVENWDSSRDVPFRVEHELFSAGGVLKKHYWHGTVRAEPWEKDVIVLAAFTGNNDLGFPNNDLVAHVKSHDPDLLFFSGDQIYEGVGGYGAQREPVHKARLDYLRKWYLYGWAYGGLLRERPSVSIPDDHDVYHGNIWGAGGKATAKEGSGSVRQDSGGYKMPPEWVNMVERTQTSHLPDPFDPTPVKQGIGVYYCEMNYAGISFAIIEDRKFKSAPKALIPKAEVWNGWPQNKEFAAAEEGDVPEADLLGERQLLFLRDWAADWSGKAWMKAVLSQTVFTNIATIPKEATSGAVIPGLPILEPGVYVEGDKMAADMDSNGWPQSGRRRALHEIRRGFALHIAGDQHLGSTVQYGVDEFNDAAFAICVPSISNVWPRRWFPPEPGRNRRPGSPEYTGELKDGFGNLMTVHAVSNPHKTGKKPSRLYDRATGYGIVRFRRKDRDVIFENWPRWTDPAAKGAKPYPGWPVRFNQLDNYGKTAAGLLPRIEVSGLKDPVVQVIREHDEETVYTIRINGTSFSPMVFEEGSHTVLVGDPDTRQMKRIPGLAPVPQRNEQKVKVSF